MSDDFSDNALTVSQNRRLRAVLTEAQIVEWIRLFHEKEERWPTTHHKVVWAKDNGGRWVQVPRESWGAIDQALRKSLRGLSKTENAASLQELIGKHGFTSLLTEAQIVEWLRLFHEKEGRWPLTFDMTVWSKDGGGQWAAVPDENWGAIDRLIQRHARGLNIQGVFSLAALRSKYGFVAYLTEAQIVRWIRWFHEKENRWPTRYDKIVWEKTESGQWQQAEGENWAAIDGAIQQHTRGLYIQDVSSLPALRDKHGLNNDLTEAQIVRWVKLFHEKENRWPWQKDKIVWDKGKNGEWVQVSGETWIAINASLVQGLRGLYVTGLSSLAALKNKHGFNNLLTEAQIVQWIRWFREKENRWPTGRDKIVWRKEADGGWIAIPGESWGAISHGLKNGTRGLHKVEGAASLTQLRDKYNLGARLTHEKIAAWILLYREKTGREPRKSDRAVWFKVENGRWTAVPDESWEAIDAALGTGARGLGHMEGVTSLTTFKHRYPFPDVWKPSRPADPGDTRSPLTHAKIAVWVRLFEKKAGREPTRSDAVVWAKDKNNDWIKVPDESWATIDDALKEGSRGLEHMEGIASLTTFIHNYPFASTRKPSRPPVSSGKPSSKIKPRL